MTIGAEIPFRRSRRQPDATGSLIFDRARDMHVRRHEDSHGGDLHIWMNGHFRRP